MTPITIGMATFDDFDGTWFSVDALRLYHYADLRDCEILVIDNNPEGADGQAVKNFIEGWAKDWPCPARYIPYTEATGTANAKEQVFAHATKEAVLCMDSHVLLPAGTIGRLRQWYTDNPDCFDLLSGPMFYDNLVRAEGVPAGNTLADMPLMTPADHICTHFDPVWRGEMWGIWAVDQRGYDPDGEPFEIWGNGLGLFSCRREAWLGFNANFSGFGGEEGYIHESFRQAGRKALCLPWLRWLHRFGRPGGVPYPLMRWHKVRNYVVGFQELGLDLAPIYEHFVASGLLPKRAWEYLLEDPIGHVDPPERITEMDLRKMTLEDFYQKCCRVESDINEHAPKLRELAAQCDRVTEFGVRHGVSTVALLAGQPARLVSYDLNRDGITLHLNRVKGDCDFQFVQGDVLEVDPIEPTDLLFIDTKHTGKQLLAELNRHGGAVGRWIVLHDTQIFGEIGEDGSPGLLVGLREWLAEHPEWRIVYQVENNNGLTVLEKCANTPIEDLNEEPEE